MNKIEEALNNLNVNISLINNETIRDKSFEDLEIVRKAFKLIKQKMIDIIWIYGCNNQIEYNDKMVKKWECKPTAYFLTKDEFNFLKEVLFEEED